MGYSKLFIAQSLKESLVTKLDNRGEHCILKYVIQLLNVTGIEGHFDLPKYQTLESLD